MVMHFFKFYQIQPNQIDINLIKLDWVRWNEWNWIKFEYEVWTLHEID